MLKKFPLNKVNVAKNVLFFLSCVPTRIVLLLIRDSYTS